MYNDENIVLCACNSYKQKYFLNSDFDSLPEGIKQELNILSVLFTEDIGGVLIIEFDMDGNLLLKTDFLENTINASPCSTSFNSIVLLSNINSVFLSCL